MITYENNGCDLRGVSTDEKPVDVAANTMFHELDTDKKYYFDGEAWQEIGGGTNGG